MAFVPLRKYFLAEAPFPSSGPPVEQFSITAGFSHLLFSMVLENSVHLEDFKSVVDTYTTEFQTGVELDSHDFLLYLLDQFASETPPNNANFVKFICSGTFRSLKHCNRCRQTPSIVFDPFTTISLPLTSQAVGRSQKKAKTLKIPSEFDLEHCLRCLITPEVLSGDNTVNCEHCQQAHETISRITISTLPPLLIFQLKRFEISSSSQKITASVSFPLTNLDMAPYLSESTSSTTTSLHVPPTNTYSLFAITNHHGDSIHFGHYTADVRSDITGNWISFNGSATPRETLASEFEANNKTAYILFYLRDDFAPTIFFTTPSDTSVSAAAMEDDL